MTLRLFRKPPSATVISLAAVLAAALPSHTRAGEPTSAPAARQSLAVPAYFAPGKYWKQMDAAHPPLQLTIINPNNGPGAARDSNYARAVHAAQSAGIRVLGYVYTDYAKRTISAVEADVNAYYSWYHVDGIFFDEASTSCSREPYYASLNQYVKGKGGVGKTILNPGTQTHECYVAAADVLLTFEGSDNTYLHSYSAARWVSEYPASRFWHVVYATPTPAALAHVIALSERRHAGYVYATQLKLPNPYDALPTGSYWSDELSEVRR